MKTCITCLKEQPFSRFSFDGKKYASYCRPCHSARNNINNKKVPSRNRYNRYGLTGRQFTEMLEAQNNCCKICKEVMERQCVDHDHATGKVRGILCFNCNVALGHFKDNASNILEAYNYIRGQGECQPQSKEELNV